MKCQRNPWYWIRAWVLTEHVHGKEGEPFQPFPDKEHLWYLTQIWLLDKRVLVPKSRQMTATWLFCALYLWDAIFFPSRLSFFQSKREEDADANLERAWAMYNHLPKFMRLWQPAKRTYCHIKFSRNRSHLWAIPQGAEYARQYTCSGYFADEMAFQIQMDEVLAAVNPTLGTKGRFTGVSSAAPSYFKSLCFDET